MNTREELDEIDRLEADIAVRLRLRGGLNEGPPTCPPLTAEEAAEDEALGLRPFPFEEWQALVEAARVRGREFIKRSEEACRRRDDGKIETVRRRNPGRH